MADLDPALMQKIFDIPERKREPNVEHDCQADDFGAGFEIAKWTAFCHPAKLGCRPARLKPVSFDSAYSVANIIGKLRFEMVTCHGPQV